MKKILSVFVFLLLSSVLFSQRFDPNGRPIAASDPVINVNNLPISGSQQQSLNPITRSCSAPTSNDVSICGSGSATLTASGSSGNYTWYDASSGGNVVGTGSTFNTPLLNSTTTYYVDAFCGIFSDDFEDGNVSEYGGVVTFTASTDVAHTGSWSGKMPGDCGSDHYCDAYIDLGGAQPVEISYYLYVSSSNIGAGYFVLQDGTVGDVSTQVVFIYFYNGNTLRTIGSDGNGSDVYVDLSASYNTWYHIELKDINWTNHTLDVYYNGTLMYNDLKFRGYTNANKIDRIFIYNYDGGVAYYDDIDIGERSSRTPVTVNVVPPATADAGADDQICEGSSYTLNGQATNYSSVTWSTSGSGTFDNSSSLNATYTPSAADISNGSVTLTLTAHGNSPCGDVSDDMILTIVPSATADAGADDHICEGNTYTLNGQATNYSSVTWSTSGSGTFDNSSYLNATYTPSAADISNGSVTLTLTAHGNSPCGDVSDDMILTIAPNPTVNAGPDDNVCEGSSYSLNGQATDYDSIAWTTSGTGSFDDASILNAVYTPSADDILAGNVVLTLTAYSSCGTATDDMQIAIVPPPTANAGTSDFVCEGNSYTLNGQATNYSSISWTTSGSGTFDDPTSLTATYTPSQDDINAGFVILTLNVQGNSPCGSSSSSMTLTINPAPGVDLGSDISMCSNSSIQLNATLQQSATSVTWTTLGDGTFDNENSLTPFYTPGANDISNGSVYLVATTDAPQACSPASDTVLVTINPAPQLSATYNDLTSCVSPDGEIFLHVQNGTSPYTYSIDAGNTFTADSVFSNLDVGNYDCMVMDANGCSDTVTVSLSSASGPSIDTVIVQDVACHGDSSGVITIVATGAVEYSIDTTFTQDSVFNNLSAGTYVVTVRDSGMCTDNATVTVTQPEELSLTSDVTNYSCGQGGEIVVHVIGGTPPYTYSWSNGGTDSIISNLQPDTFTVTVTDYNGCSAVLTSIVESDGGVAQVQVSTTDVTCYGLSDGTATATMLNGTAPYSYSWNTGDTTSTINHLGAGTYTVTVSDVTGCTGVDSGIVNEPLPLSVNYEITNPQCYGDTVTIVLTVTGGNPPYLYDWSNGSVDSVVYLTQQGEYEVTITDDNGCDTVLTFNVNYNGMTPLVVSDTVYQNNGYEITIGVNVSGGTLPYSYLWNTGERDSIITVSQSGEYMVTVTDDNGCTASDTVKIVMNLKIPTVITPNGDGANDTWKIVNIGTYDDVTIRIFNRWGDLVYDFHGNGYDYLNPKNQWDGMYNGKLLPFGEYFYVIKLGKEVYKGTVLVKY